jgi:HSP20 family protein
MMLGELQPGLAGWPSLDQFRRDMDDLFDRFFGGVRSRSLTDPMITWPATESFFKKNGNWAMRFDLPGVEPKEIDVSVAGNEVTVRASRRGRSAEQNQESREVSYGRFERSVTLPKEVGVGEIKAPYQHGLLELTMPALPQLAARKIRIEKGTGKKEIEHKAP